jgi:tetratricopeptide (TPR) repeat protein
MKAFLSLILIIILTSFSQVSGNKIDSLKSLLGDINDTSNYRIYKELFFEFVNLNLDSALFYVDIGLKQAEIGEDLYQTGMFSSRKGRIFFEMGKTSESKEYFHKAVESFQEIHDTVNLISDLSNYGCSLMEASRFKEASDVLFQALSLSEESNYTFFKAI